MKNKFKKSKIIVPALALITATTVASVTGTVAWFTANRAVTVSASTFVATKVESNLVVTTEGRIGTKATADNGITTTTDTNVTNKLTHGSYDAQTNAAGSLYVAQISDDGTSITDFTDLGTEDTAKSATATTSANKWLARNDSTANTKTWYGVSWTMKFSLQSASTNTADYLFLDPSASTYTNSGSGTTTTAPGFRIAFMTNSTFKVMGGDSITTHVDANMAKGTYQQTSDTAVNANKTYYTRSGQEGSYTYTKVTNPNATDINSYYEKSVNTTYANYTTSDNYWQVGANVAKAADANEATTLTNNKLYLGSVGYTSSEEGATDKSLTVTCVAWYEGSDEYVADKKDNTTIDMSSISASLVFYTRGVIAA